MLEYNLIVSMAMNWKGFYIQDGQAHPMEFIAAQIELKPSGSIAGEGRDEVGVFRIDGCFHPQLTLCRFTKQYQGQHPVYY